MKFNEERVVSCKETSAIKSDVTEIVFIIDRSGSMEGFEADTIGGFNSTVAAQKEGEGRVYVSTVLFDNVSEVIHDRVLIEDVKPMTRQDYRVGGCTALLDALGDAIHHIGNIHKYAREEDVPKHTIFVIITDGMENASRKYDSKTIKEKIKRQTEKYGWEFLFLAANIDAVETAKNIGIRRERAGSWDQSSRGIEKCYEEVSCYCRAIRNNEDFDSSDNKRRERKK